MTPLPGLSQPAVAALPGRTMVYWQETKAWLDRALAPDLAGQFCSHMAYNVPGEGCISTAQAYR